MTDENNLTEKGMIIECENENSVVETKIISSSEAFPSIHAQLINMMENMNTNIGFLKGRIRR